MRRLVFALLIGVVLVLGGCGDDDDSPPPPPAQIVSDPAFDGDIARSVTGQYKATQGDATLGKIYVGLDPADGAELRAFIDFPLGGSGGVPLNAAIAWATLELFISDIQPSPFIGTIPLRIELVPFAIPLAGPEFQSVPLTSMAVTFSISQADFGQYVLIDVTDLMVEAQRLSLADLQLRIRRDTLSLAPGLIEIDDTTGPNRNQLAPFLEVGYF